MSKSGKNITLEQATAEIEKWINIRNATDEEATIDIDGDIGEDWWGESQNTVKAVKSKLKEISALKAKKIFVNINSYGGSVSHGLGIHDILAQHSAEVITDVQGLTASSATVIAQAGDTRRMSDNALYLIHQPWSMFVSNVTELEQDLEDMKTVNNRLVKIYTKRSGSSEEDIRSLMDENNGNGKWVDADEALELGLIDEIYEPMEAAASLAMKPEAKAAMRLPDLPAKKSPTTKNSNDMSDDKKTIKEMFSDFKAEIREMLNLDKDAEVPENVASKLTDFDNRIEAAEKAAADSATEVERLTGELESATASISEKETEITNLTTAKNELDGKLTKLNAKSSKTKGPEGIENTDAPVNKEMASLNADAAKIRDELMVAHSDDHVDEDED